MKEEEGEEGAEERRARNLLIIWRRPVKEREKRGRGRGRERDTGGERARERESGMGEWGDRDVEKGSQPVEHAAEARHLRALLLRFRPTFWIWFVCLFVCLGLVCVGLGF